MKEFRYRTLIVMMVLFLATAGLCAAGGPLRTEEMKTEDVTGVFTLIYYGARHGDDIETVMILDLEGDQYTFEPYAPEFDYRVEKDVPAEEALKRAKMFAGWHPDFRRFQLSRILDDGGKIIGYEVRPLYDPLALGMTDVLDVDYWLKGSTVKVTIKTKPEIETRRRSTGGSKDGDH